MSRTAIALSGLLILPNLAMAKKKKKSEGASTESAAASATPDTPDDSNSKKFAANLISQSFSNFRPSDTDGAKFEYTSLQFKADNSWSAEGYVEIQDERMECTESGKWTMDPADSDRKATVSWSLESTDCAGREQGQDTRAVVTIAKDGSMDAAFR